MSAPKLAKTTSGWSKLLVRFNAESESSTLVFDVDRTASPGHLLSAVARLVTSIARRRAERAAKSSEPVPPDEPTPI